MAYHRIILFLCMMTVGALVGLVHIISDLRICVSAFTAMQSFVGVLVSIFMAFILILIGCCGCSILASVYQENYVLLKLFFSLLGLKLQSSIFSHKSHGIYLKVFSGGSRISEKGAPNFFFFLLL